MINSDNKINEAKVLRKRIKKEIRNIKMERIFVSVVAFVIGFVFCFVLWGVFMLVLTQSHEALLMQALKMGSFGGVLGFYIKYTDMKDHTEQSIECYKVAGKKMVRELSSKKDKL